MRLTWYFKIVFTAKAQSTPRKSLYYFKTYYILFKQKNYNYLCVLRAFAVNCPLIFSSVDLRIRIKRQPGEGEVDAAIDGPELFAF